MPGFDDLSSVGTGKTGRMSKSSGSSNPTRDGCRLLENVPAAELLEHAQDKRKPFRAQVNRPTGWAAMPKSAQILIVAASVLVLFGGVISILVLTVFRGIFWPWNADLTGEFNGSPVQYVYPCILDESAYAYAYGFDSGSPVEIKFQGTENLTDSKGHALKSPWVWSSSHDVGVHSLSTNQSMRVDNDPLRAFEIAAHQWHVPARLRVHTLRLHHQSLDHLCRLLLHQNPHRPRRWWRHLIARYI